jgi:hypothetical protein
MAAFSFKRTLIKGIALGAPLAIALYVFLRFVKIFEKIIAPFAKKFEVESIFGEITLSILAILSMLVLTFLLGLLMQLPFIAKLSRQLEDIILNMVPSLNHLKLMAVEKLDAENASTNWKPVLIEKGNSFLPAYLIEESADWITYSKIKIPGTDPGDVVVEKREGIGYTAISMTQLRQYNKQFGKGYISMIEKDIH